MMTDASSDISGAAWQRKYTLLGGRFTATLIGTTRRETLSLATLRSASMSSNTDSGELSTNLISGFFASSDIVLLLDVRGLAFDVSEGLRQRRHTVAEKAVAGACYRWVCNDDRCHVVSDARVVGQKPCLRLGAFWSAWPQLRAGEHLRVGHGGRSERICASWGSPPQEFGNVEPVIGGQRGLACGIRETLFELLDLVSEREILALKAAVLALK